MDIPKSYEPKEVEKRWYPFWESHHFFSPEANPDPSAPIFSMVIPPPNVTGYLHMGHALNHTLQDVIVRWRRMEGDRVLWLPGTDHAGIATQMVVERRLAAEGIQRKEIGREEFVQRVWDWKQHSGGAIQNQMRTLGESVDWTRERFTLDDGLSSAVREVFVRLYDEGLIYRGEYLINWSTGLQTAISDLEVEMKPVNGKLYHIAYPVKTDRTGLVARYEGIKEALEAETTEVSGDGSQQSGIVSTPEGQFVIVATTRPETMLGDTAIAINPEDERYGSLKNAKVILPLIGRELPVIQDSLVEKDFGTGIVKVTPSHDPNDFQMGRRHNLSFISVIGKDARMTDQVPEKYRGLDRYEARKQVVEDLESAGLLIKVEDYLHNVGHCQRSGVVIEPLVSTQWFMRMTPLAKPALEAVRDGRTRFVPENMARIYSNWLENIQDWCISRQLWWGHRIPAWYTEDDQIIVGRSEEEARERLAATGRDKNAALSQDPDVLDTWFSSSLWPFSTLGWPKETDDIRKYYPTTVLVTGPDIIFFWVARMMMMGLKFMGDVPFRTVYINGLVLDPEGQKMSKTKGNVIDPLVVFDRFGTDAVRYALTAAATPGMPISIQESKLEAARNFANKIWNASRFVLMNGGEELDSPKEIKWETELSEPVLADRWILSKFNRVALDVSNALAEYRLHEAAATAYHFFWDDFCDWYIELSKPHVTSKDESDESRAVRRRIIYILEKALRLLHPFMPFITEELWHRLPHTGETIALAAFPTANAAELDGRAEKEMEFVIELITRLRSIRSVFNIAPSQSIQVGIATTDEALRSLIVTTSDYIERLARVSKITLADSLSTTKGYARTVVGNAEIEVPLEGLIDFDKERKRLDAEITKLNGEQQGLRKRLENPDFVSRAAPDVVATTRAREEEISGQISRLSAIIEGF